ncbi:MAG: hypothetical protein IKG27_04960 [Bacilli bacterium]|nr:hypothetical protein [Bacilli bacterium]
MLEKLEKEIELTEELLNGLPVNNKKNKERFLKEISLEMESYQKKIDDVKTELKRRLEPFENLKYEEISNNDVVLKNLLKALSYTNTLSTAYEKLDLDKIVYQLTNYSDDELINNNIKILKAINIFKAANCPLMVKDFNYTNEVHEYVPMFFEEGLTNQKIKEVFDNVYWKCPDIMIRVELNLRYLYLKNKARCEKYIELVNRQVKERFTKAETSILDDYNFLRRKQKEFSSKTNMILDFYNQNKDIEEYTDEKIAAITANLFKNNDYDESKIVVIKQLLNSLKEYKSYLKYKDLIDKARELYKDNIEKDYMKKTLKKISGLEGKLFKLNKKDASKESKTSTSKVEPEINAKIAEIKALYDEIDTNIFKVAIKEHIRDNSTLFKVLLLACQYYKILADYFKEKEEGITYDVIDQRIDELFDFTMDPSNTLINNVTILEERELSDIIITNYKMLNINIEESLADESSIESLISDLERIVTNYQMKVLGIPISKLRDAKMIKAIDLN